MTRVTLGDIATVGKGTPGGEWLRRYWLVVGIAAELGDVPAAVRILGEDLVLFRTGNGQPGLFGMYCPHRGASLEYADVEPDGLRCIYHGWAFDVCGRCTDQPAEPARSTLRGKVRHVAYPVREQGGLLFAYLGPNSDEPPPLPSYAPLVTKGGVRRIEPVREMDYNWFNFYENVADPVHLWILHRYAGYGQGTWGNGFFSFDDPPDWKAAETALGIQVTMTKPGPAADTEFVNVYSLVLPSTVQINDTEFVHMRMDDPKLDRAHNEHTMFVTPRDDDHFALFTVDYYTGSDANFHDDLKQRREKLQASLKAAPGDHRRFGGFRGSLRLEDIVTQSLQPRLGQRAERLGVSDQGVILLRRVVMKAIGDAMAGRQPKGVLGSAHAGEVINIGAYAGLRSKEAVR